MQRNKTAGTWQPGSADLLDRLRAPRACGVPAACRGQRVHIATFTSAGLQLWSRRADQQAQREKLSLAVLFLTPFYFSPKAIFPREVCQKGRGTGGAGRGELARGHRLWREQDALFFFSEGAAFPEASALSPSTSACPRTYLSSQSCLLSFCLLLCFQKDPECPMTENRLDSTAPGPCAALSHSRSAGLV